MGDTSDEQADRQPLSERFLDLFVFLPTGLAVTVAEELPRLAERGRDRLGVQVNSARAVGHLAVKAGHKELKKRSEGLKRSGDAPTGTGADTPKAGGATPTPPAGPPRLRTIPYPPDPTVPGPTAHPLSTVTTPTPAPAPTVDAHVPDVASLAIPGFDTLSASQVVQRLDGLTRSELVAVRTYETSSRGRRTILSRVDQLMDERS
jgi:hypothetical protein